MREGYTLKAVFVISLLVYMKAILCRAGVEGGAAKQLMRKKGALSRYYVDSQRRNTGLNHSNVDNVLGMSVPFAAVIILTSIGSKRDKRIRFFGLRVLHDLRCYAVPRCWPPSHPDTKVRCAVMMIRPACVVAWARRHVVPLAV